MLKPADVRELAIDIAGRSRCAVRVGAAIADRHGIISWGWNSEGPSGYGLCAERHAIQRANKRRLQGATIYVAGVRDRNDKLVPARPCELCERVIRSYNLKVMWRGNDGEWNE